MPYRKSSNRDHAQRWFYSCLCWLLCTLGSTAHAQAGPPLVTDDPGTPGDHHWEVNFATLLAREHAGGALHAQLDADMNYGWGDHLQLKLDIPLSYASEPSEQHHIGIGSTAFGIKWRFMDSDDGGLSMSTYPQFVTGWTRTTVDKGLAESLHTYVLPIEVAKTLGSIQWVGEIGRTFSSDGSSHWIAGIVAAHEVTEGTTALLELHDTRNAYEHVSLINLGLRADLSKHLSLLTAVGHEFGPAVADPSGITLYLGLQVRH